MHMHEGMTGKEYSMHRNPASRNPEARKSMVFGKIALAERE